MRGHQARDGAITGFGVPAALAEQQDSRSGKIAKGAVRQLDDRQSRVRNGSEHIGKDDFGPCCARRKISRISRRCFRRIDRDVYSFRLLGIELEIARDEGSMGRGALAFERVQKPSAFDRIPCGHRVRSRGLASPCDRERVRHVQAKGCGVAVGREVCQWKPSCGKQQIRAVFADNSGMHPRHRAVLFVGQQSGIGVGEGDAAGRRHRRWKLHDKKKGILIVAQEAERLAVRALDVFYNQIRMEFDAHAAGGFRGLEIDFCDGGDGLTDSVQRR